MAPRTQTVTAKVLQALLTRIGSASSGTKATLRERLMRDIYRSRLFDYRPDWKARQDNGHRCLRLVSIDMGIKNLAYCDAEVDYAPEYSSNATMKVLRWEKIDLVKTTRNFRRHLPSPRSIKTGTADEDTEVDPYSLSVLSTTAYFLVKRILLVGYPDIILIEKQRWRSGGGSAVQQWTVRVNTLEGMIWAVLETLRSEWKTALPRLRETDTKRDYEVFGVDPKRVGHYWLGQTSADEKTLLQDKNGAEENDSMTAKKKPGRSKAEKKAKIAILRSWLSSSPQSTAPSARGNAPIITFKIGTNAEHTLQALCSPSRPSQRRKLDKSSGEKGNPEAEAQPVGDSELKKLDDITDCFLQAAAWVNWELTREQLFKVQNKMGQDDSSVLEMNEESILEMAREIGEV